MWHLNDWFPIFLSLRVAFLSLILVVLLALPLARILGLYQFKGRDILEAFFTLPLVLPPSVVGYGLLVLIGRNGYWENVVRHGYKSGFYLVGSGAGRQCSSFSPHVPELPGSFRQCRQQLRKSRPYLRGQRAVYFFPHHSAPSLAWYSFRSGVDFCPCTGGIRCHLDGSREHPGRQISLGHLLCVDQRQTTANTLVYHNFFCFFILWVNRWNRKYHQ